MSTAKGKVKPTSALAVIAPGILVAATGVGAGDLLTASLAGSAVGMTILWAAVLGAALKWFLNEGIARWQMATGTTLLEGWITRLGGWIRWVFLVYLLIWSFFTGGALVNACGVAGTGLWALSDNVETSKILWGTIHSLTGLVLVLIGGFKLFARLMSICIAVMFVTVVLTAGLIGPDWSAVARGLVTPSIPSGDGGMIWILGLLGGVGGTVTLLSYGYWIQETNRSKASGWRACRFDLGIGYTMTAVFGVAMVIIGSRVDLQKGATVALDLAEQLANVVGPWGRRLFLVGFWGAVFSSLLGVWQSVPYLFADFRRLSGSMADEPIAPGALARTTAYRVYLVALALVPLALLWLPLRTIQLSYAVIGSLFMPLLALTLLIMNNRATWVGREYRNGWITNAVLAGTLAFFVYAGGTTAATKASALMSLLFG